MVKEKLWFGNVEEFELISTNHLLERKFERGISASQILKAFKGIYKDFTDAINESYIQDDEVFYMIVDVEDIKDLDEIYSPFSSSIEEKVEKGLITAFAKLNGKKIDLITTFYKEENQNVLVQFEHGIFCSKSVNEEQLVEKR